MSDTKFYGVSDSSMSFGEGKSSGESMSNNSDAYQDFFKQAGGDMANADLSMEGGECPDGDCDGAKKSVIWKENDSSTPNTPAPARLHRVARWLIW